ncbi:methyltransferase [Leptolyngbya sp. Heron Island J]|uniref:class I SAM-dependent methyltransferase n=1 Tax=Leptolyngbya sp. Heron Island J TaxID=1385935 RepID=UPI0003B983ED|nr:methyltransferase domain-containing protein [Leptolyngbya sp. Heron Island J]ESA37977.1 methyltransferase [Leptolyngbya sp. Heron Island J]
MSHYYANAEKDSLELSRRKLVEGIQDDISIDRFHRIGIRNGWKCLEVGAGAGSIAYWLSEQVGATGHVTATDINLRFLHSDEYSNLETRKHNIESDALEENAFDFIHCRNVLMHLENSLNALNKLAIALKPHGYIVLEEPDFSTFPAEGQPQNSLASVRQVFRYMEAVVSSKRMNLYLGRNLPQALDNLGFEDIVIDERYTIEHGGSKAASIHCRGWSILMKSGTASALPEEVYASAIEHMNDPGFSFKNAANVGVWARKSAGAVPKLLASL